MAVSREQRRAKTDRLDTEMLMRALFGWLRGEPGHCRMVAIPTVEQEDARRPGREREALVGERTRLTNTIKAELALWGIQGFKPNLKKAAERLEALRTADGEPLPPNTLARLLRLLERRRLVGEQIQAIEEAAARAVERNPTGPNALVLLLAKVRGIGLETAQMLVHEVLTRNLRDRRAVARYVGLTGTPDESGSKRREKGIGDCGTRRMTIERDVNVLQPGSLGRGLRLIDIGARLVRLAQIDHGREPFTLQRRKRLDRGRTTAADRCVDARVIGDTRNRRRGHLWRLRSNERGGGEKAGHDGRHAYPTGGHDRFLPQTGGLKPDPRA